MIRLAFVVPRYGPDVLGGAETFVRQFAGHLPRREFVVTILTTCAQDLHTWRNVFPSGEMEIDGVRVLRFPVDHRRRNARLFQNLTNRANRNEPLAPEDQMAWLENAAHSPELYHHLALHGDEYDLLIFLPYLFATTIYGSAIWSAKSVVCACLHDEPYARFIDVRAMLQSVKGLMFLSQPERIFAEETLGVKHPRARVVGFGLDEFEPEPERFRHKFGLHSPFLLYAGRLDPAKNVLQLISYFMNYRQSRPGRDLRLVLAGSGPLPLPSHPDLVAVGYLEGQDLKDAYAAATVLCQPSLVESLSIVLMEAWLAGTAVLVHGQCPVTSHHVSQSSGGLYFTDAAEFAGAVDWLLDHPHERQQMAAQGRAYVRREFNWPRVYDRFRRGLSVWKMPIREAV
jgi:glycosyltransferase involved in cell wall biosynthesis